MYTEAATEVKNVAQAEGATTSGINSFIINPLYHINLCTEYVCEWSRKSENRKVIRIRMS